MSSLKGHFLVASPFLGDPNFARTVVLMVHHSDDGAFGVVLNRLASKTVRELWTEIAAGTCDSDRLLNLGGPVEGPLMAIHGDPVLAEMDVAPGVYFAARRDYLERLLRKGEVEFRLFVGHSGWGGGQLESELKQGSWLTMPATSELVFCDETDLWQRVTHQIGRNMLQSMLALPEIPDNPAVN